MRTSAVGVVKDVKRVKIGEVSSEDIQAGSEDLNSMTNDSAYSVNEMFNLNVKLKEELHTLVNQLEISLTKLQEKREKKLAEHRFIQQELQEK